MTQDFTGREEGHPDGAYVLGGLPSGSYRVAFNFDGVLQKYYDGKDSFETADPIVVTVGQTVSGIDYDVASPTITSLTSNTHPDPVQWYATNTPGFSWTAVGGVGDIDGYSYAFDHSPDTVPAATVNTTATSVTLAASADGVWYFHLRAEDGYYYHSWGPTKTLKVCIDTTAPAGSFTLNGGAATTTTPAVTVGSSVSDVNGVSDMRFSTDGKATWSGWASCASPRTARPPGASGLRTTLPRP